MTEGASEYGIRITREFDAPRERVWAEWTEPEAFADWYGGPQCEVPLASVSMDVRPGGEWQLTMFAPPDRRRIDWKGEYLEVVAPERLVFTTRALEDEEGNAGLEVLNTVTFAEVGDTTHVTLRAVVVAATPDAASALDGMEDGWTQTLDRLADHLADHLATA